KVTSGRKPDLVRSLGATYHHDLDNLDVTPDVVIECTGVAEVVFGVLRGTARNAVTVRTGISGGQHALLLPAGAINDALVLEDDALVGSLNAALRSYQQAARALAHADRNWLRGLITRRESLSAWTATLGKNPDDIKVVVDLQETP